MRFSCIPISFYDNYFEPFLMKIIFIGHCLIYRDFKIDFPFVLQE